MQSAKPALHAKVHAEFEQTGDAFGRPGQTIPQPLQSFTSSVVLTSQPSLGSLLQSANPVSQAIPQDPDEQIGVEFASLGQVVPQPPQFAGSACSFTHTPLQRVNPELQTSPQMPAEQLAVAFGSDVVQALPQPPQLARSVCSFTQTPLQLVKPESQEDVQSPPEQNAPAFGSDVVQTWPQPPQFEESFSSLTSQPSVASPLQSRKPALQA